MAYPLCLDWGLFLHLMMGKLQKVITGLLVNLRIIFWFFVLLANDLH